MQNDEGVANNCFNLDCGGFVHTGNDKHFALGGSFFPDSQVGGDLFTVTFGIHRVRVREASMPPISIHIYIDTHTVDHLNKTFFFYITKMHTFSAYSRKNTKHLRKKST